ncbi:MAG: hypothetical protein JWM95_2162 [Gemmatimonadetes bacterium]|nr:hypothetical protein [Gemmatimonadota bacterium]
MDSWKETGMPLLVGALLYLIVLRVTGELHRSSKALEFFAMLWVVQAIMALLQGRRHPPKVPSVGTAPAGDIPPIGDDR